jgi:membrane protein required for colicin V production
MNVVDVVILAALALAILTGLRHGLLVELALILGAVIALAVARPAYAPVRDALVSIGVSKGAWLTTLSYLIVYLVVWVAIVDLARLGRRGMRLLFLGWADRLGGAVLGFLQGLIVVELLLYFGKRVPNHDLRRLIKQSQLAPTFLNLIPHLQRLFPHVPGH